MTKEEGKTPGENFPPPPQKTPPPTKKNEQSQTNWNPSKSNWNFHDEKEENQNYPVPKITQHHSQGKRNPKPSMALSHLWHFAFFPEFLVREIFFPFNRGGAGQGFPGEDEEEDPWPCLGSGMEFSGLFPSSSPLRKAPGWVGRSRKPRAKG